jgi:DNA-binding NarL/FixJ family response regulator
MLPRAPLSASEFEAAWSAGKQMTLEDALLLARTPVRPSAADASYATSSDMLPVASDTYLQQHLSPEAAQPPEVHKKSKSFGLSRREIEVAQLITQGRTNRVIASELVLSERTVENHIANIMAKLSFNTRSQIAAWVVEVGLQKQK